MDLEFCCGLIETRLLGRKEALRNLESLQAERIQSSKVSVKQKACQTIMKVKDTAEKSNDFAACLHFGDLEQIPTFQAVKMSHPLIDMSIDKMLRQLINQRAVNHQKIYT